MSQSLGSILARLLREAGLSTKLAEAAAPELWAEAAGPEIAAKTRALKVDKRVLTVVTANPTWSHQLSLLKTQLLDRLEKLCGERVIDDIRFQVGRISRAPARPGAAVGEREEEVLAAQLEDSPGIDDPDLRRVFRRLRRKQTGLENRLRQDGWRPCPVCGALQPGPGQAKCFLCRQGESQRRIEQLERILSQSPWLRADEAMELVAGLTAEEYRTAKRQRIARLERQVFGHWKAKGNEIPPGALELVLLAVGRRPEEIEADHVRWVFGRRRGEQLWQYLHSH